MGGRCQKSKLGTDYQRGRFFEFRALSFGKYRVEVEHPRSKKEVIENVALQMAQTDSLTVTLQVGSVKESIVVQGGSGLLEASDASLSQVIDDKRLLREFGSTSTQFQSYQHRREGDVEP